MKKQDLKHETPLTKEQIQEKIDKNRDLIERALHTGLDLCLLVKIVKDLKERNDRLIEQLNIMIESEESKSIKSLFVTYFDGCYGTEPVPDTLTTYRMGVCKLEYKDTENELVVHLRRPGLLIGKGGRTRNALIKYLESGIAIIEVDILK